MSAPLLLETIVKPWGKIVAVGMIDGERYYWMIDKHGSVSMMPGDEVERVASPHPKEVDDEGDG